MRGFLSFNCGIMNIMSRLDQATILKIEKAVEQIKLDTGLSYPQNSLSEIAEALGARVVSANLPDFEGKRVKGCIKWFSESEKEANIPFTAQIYLNSNQSDLVRNFTLAHEIGHLLLHKNSDSFRIDLQDYSAEGDPKNQETEANYFAGSLLMPKDKLIPAIYNAKNLDEVALAFGVSLPAVEARLKWLGMSVA